MFACVVPSDRYGIIYVATHRESGRQYVGQTRTSLAKRLKGHRDGARNPRVAVSYFHRAITKYGMDAFGIDTLDWATSQEELDHKEQFWIAFLNTMDPRYGYNLRAGGAKGRLSHQSREQISRTKRASSTSSTIGRPCDPSIKRSQRALGSNRGPGPQPWRRIPVFCVELERLFDSHTAASLFIQQTHPDSKIDTICTNIARTTRSKGTAYGFHWERRSPIAPVRSRRPVVCVETGRCFPSLSEAERIMRSETGLGGSIRAAVRTTISHCHSAFGYHWRYAD